MAAFKGDKTRTIVRLNAAPGEAVDLDASASTDPDGDSLSFKWYMYPEAGTYKGNITIDDSNRSRTGFRIPEDAAAKQIHIILEVSDQNSIVDLTSYRRIVFDVE